MTGLTMSRPENFRLMCEVQNQMQTALLAGKKAGLNLPEGLQAVSMLVAQVLATAYDSEKTRNVALHGFNEVVRFYIPQFESLVAEQCPDREHQP